MRLPWLLLPAGIGLWSATATAFPTARLQYELGPGTEQCPDEASMRRAVSTRLGYDPFDSAAPQLLRTRLERAADRFQAVLELLDQTGEVQAQRRLENAGTCEELASAIALSMSIAIDPERAFQQPSEGASQPTMLESNAAARASEPTAPAEQKLGRPSHAAGVRGTLANQQRSGGSTARGRQGVASVRPRVGTAAHLSVGTEPSPAVGISVLVGARLSRWSLNLEGRYDAPASTELVTRGSTWATLGTLGFFPCRHQNPLVFCLAGVFGRLSAGANGVSDPRSDASFFAGAGSRIGLEVPLAGAISVQARGDLLVTLRPLSIVFNNETVWKAAPLTGSVSAGVVAQF